MFQTKRELAISTLREAIQTGRYVPGQQLRQTQLMADLSLGSTPVREAVLELLARGMLVQESHHSVRVAELDIDRIRNIYRVRALLETEAARLGTARITDDAIARMGDLLAVMVEKARENDLAAAIGADADFREALYGASGNALLVALIDQVWSSFPGSILWNIPGRIPRSLKEHRVILRAVASRDPTAAASAVDQHLASALAALETHVSGFTKRAAASRKTPQ